MLIRVARWLGVTNGTPSEVIGALEEVAACCVTVLAAPAPAAKLLVLRHCGRATVYRSLWLDSEDATYTVTLATVC